MQTFLRSVVVGLALCLLGAVPAAASEGILMSGATEVPVGTSIVGKSSSAPTFYSGSTGYVNCTGANLAGSLYSNGSSSAQIKVESLNFSGSASEGKCSNTAGAVGITLHATSCLRYTNTGPAWYFRGNACDVAPGLLSLTFDWSWGKCRYGTTEHATFTSVVNSEPLIATQSAAGRAFNKVEGGVFCPPSLTLKSLNLQLETGSGQGLKLIK